ncbi:MAG: glutamate-cysteine ligase family protein [Candidatus Helarchaeota archaeon]
MPKKKEQSRVWSFNEKNPLELPFSHGLECEIALLMPDGSLPAGNEMIFVFKRIVEDSLNELIDILDSDFCPKMIKDKLVGMPQITFNEEKGDVITQGYKIGGDTVNIEIFGRDGNVAAITYILELVTPPATHLDELIWWLQTLFTVAQQVTVPQNLYLCSTGLPPLIKEYMRGLTYSDHHHMGGFKDEYEKKRIYNMFRAFVPHIIALTANSPLINGAPTDVVKTIGNDPMQLRYAAPGCIRSIRLQNNVSMLSRNDPKVYIPHLDPDTDANYFLNVIQKASIEDAKFQDIFPFSEWKTIEFRVCDAPLSISKRIGIVLLLQALALKAREMKEIPDVSSNAIVANRHESILRGLYAPFKSDQIPDIASVDTEFANMYLGEKDKRHKYMFEAIRSMLEWLFDPLKQIKIYDKKALKDFKGISPFISPILLSVFGNLDIAQAPFGECEFQLLLYNHYIHKNPQSPAGPLVLRDLIKATFKSKDPYYTPIGGELPIKELKWIKL